VKGFDVGVLAVIAVAGQVAGAVSSVRGALNALDADRSVILQIDNNTDTALWRVWDHHSGGGWAVPPESDLPGRHAMVFGSRDRGFMTGTKGAVAFDGDGFQLVARWSNPYVGKNTSDVAVLGLAGGKFFARHEAGAGSSNAHMHYELFPQPRVGDVVRFGEPVRLRHLFSYRTLHSHKQRYRHKGGSGQQQVTGFGGADDNDLFLVKGPHGTPRNERQGDAPAHDDVIRLEHCATGRNLHSHGGIPSPVTRQQEVSCFGTDGVGDGGDNWRLEAPTGQWRYGDPVRLIHVDTNHALHSHSGHSDDTNTAGQQEVTCFAGRDLNDYWAAFEHR
jgi:hypothetical protein